MASYIFCHDLIYNCPGTVLVSRAYTIKYTVNIIWDGMTISTGGSISQSITGDQMYQCVVAVTDQPTRIRNIIKFDQIYIL